MPIFYPENNEARQSDNEMRSLHKLVSAGITGSSSGSGTLKGAGAPAAGLGSDGDIYVDTTNKDIYAKFSGTWTLSVDIV